jgi:glucuronide carrier protein
MKKLTMRNYLGYAAGDLANNLAFSLQALFLLIYYTNVVGLNPAPIATMLLVVRAWDAFADLAAGRLVDLTRTRWGKFRPYLLFAWLPLLLSSVAFSVSRTSTLRPPSTFTPTSPKPYWASSTP